MLYWLHRFQSEYVCKQDPPPVNFFFDGKDSERYAQFLQDTNDLQATVEILEHVPHNQIQRAGGVRQNLFLD